MDMGTMAYLFPMTSLYLRHFCWAVLGKRGHQVLTDGDDAAHLSHGVHDTYTKTNLRYSQVFDKTSGLASPTIVLNSSIRPSTHSCIHNIHSPIPPSTHPPYWESQVSPLDMYQEVNTGTNLPAQIDIYLSKVRAVSVSFCF